MINPDTYIQNTRETYSRFMNKQFTEVLVQVKDEDPAWIPYDTLVALLNI
tara:strand:+ start:1349 stop:1498 length:150 start_codon:yes stop_codon:yes gene_type:complete